MDITRTSFNFIERTHADKVVSLDDARLEIGSFVLAQLPVESRSVTYPGDAGSFTLVTASAPNGHVMVMWTIEQPVSPYAVGIPG